jgi:signal transduction histidine kinase
MNDMEQRYQEIFEHAPVALLEQDLTEVCARIQDLEAKGAGALGRYLDEHPEAVAELASTIRILDANRHAVRLYEAGSKEDLLGGIDRTFDPGSFPVFKALFVGLAAGKPQIEAEMPVRTLRGQRLCVLATWVMLERGRPRRRGILAVVDISTRKQMEDALRQSGAALQRSSQELEHFAYIASHDLQEPLRMVASYAQLLARRYAGALDERADKYIHYVTDGARRMQSLISDLLLLSRVGTKGKPLRPTDCAEVVDEVLRDMRSLLRDSEAQVSCDALPVVLADAPQLAELFQNLISNAIKFRGEVAPQVHISAKRDGGAWILSVEDNGIGIEEKHLDTIFLAFRRLHVRDRYPGTGIGLAIAKKIVERHGGRIWVESQPGHGSTFYVSLTSA